MPVELFIAGRYLKAKRKGLFAFVTTAIGVAGVTIGVAALIATLSVMNGFQTDIQKKIVGAQSHMTIAGDFSPAGAERVSALLAKESAVVAHAPFALGQAILTARGRSTGVVFRGIDPEREAKVSSILESLTSGAFELGKDKVVIGEELARTLGVWTGDEVTLVSPEGVQTPLGIFPRMQKFKVAGTIRTGYYEFDASFAYMSLKAAGEFLGKKEPIAAISVRLQDMDQARLLAERLQDELGFPYVVRTFADMNRTLFAALKLEKAVMFLILGLIVLVATFNIASNLLVLSTEKARDVGILRAIGLTRGGARRLFWWVGAMIGCVGVACGTALGVLLSWAIGRFQILELPADIYYLSRVPVDIQALDVAAVALTAFVLCVLATVYPAWRASQVDPVEAIHYG